MAVPRRNSDWVDQLVLAPWWLAFSLAVLTYVFLPVFLPAGFRLVTLPVAFVFVCLAGLSVLRSWKNRWLLDRQSGLDSILQLSSKAFENLLGEAYRRQGYKVEETLTTAADGGVDLVLRRNGDVTLVQCKRFRNKPVPVQMIRELYGVLHDRHATGAKLVTTSSFTSDAKAFAAGKPIELVGKHELLRLIGSVQERPAIGALSSESKDGMYCPLCNSPMVKRKARRGSRAGSEFWGCPKYPDCRGTRPI
jgi:restriction system protein